MSEENGMIKNGNLNGVGIAKSISQNLTNFSSFTISPSTTTTPPPPTTTTTTASASSSTLSTIGTSNSLANSISNSNNSVRANNESTANVTSPPNGLNGGGGGGGGGNVVDPSNGDCGDQKPTNNNNGNIGAYPNALGGRLQFFKGKQIESKLSSIVALGIEWHEPRNIISLVTLFFKFEFFIAKQAMRTNNLTIYLARSLQ